MNLPIYIFGYGSLLLESSLRRTCPNAQIIETYIVDGYKRVCNVEFETHCAKNIEFCKDSTNFFVNGVIFKVSDEEEFNQLLIREKGYDIIQISHPTLEVYTFSAKQNLNNRIYNTKRQKEYLQTCINGAKERGEEFHKLFLQSTFVDEKLLEEYDIEELLKLA
ncbi:MAG: gamma-glutamylcyclotransferase family protein [Candidatus Nanoarchaeia archaeon]